MRITLTLDRDVADRLKLEIRRSGKAMMAVVNEALRLGRGLVGRPVRPPRFEVKPTPSGSSPGSVSIGSIVDGLESEETARKLRRWWETPLAYGGFMRVHTLSWQTLVGLVILSFAGAPVPLLAQTASAKATAPAKVAAPAAGTATGSLTVAGKSAVLTHAVAFNAGARIYVVITGQALPPDEAKSEFELAKYQFLHKVVGLELTLDHTRKVTETAYRWELAKTPCVGCFDVSLSGGPDGPLTGTVKTTAQGEAEKLKVDVTFSAPFAKPSAAKR